MFSEIQKCSLFKEFNKEELKAIEGITNKKTIKKGTYAFRENTPGDSLLVIRLGSIRLTKQTKSGDDQELTILGSGAYVGEMSIFDQTRRSATGTALEDTEILIIPYDRLRELLNEKTGMAAKFYKALAKGIARRLTFMNDDFATMRAFMQRKQ